MENRWSSLPLILGCLLIASGSALAQPVGIIDRLEGRSGGSAASIAAVGSSSATDPDVRAALELADRGKPWSAIRALGKLRRQKAKRAQANYYLAWLYDRLYEKEWRAGYAQTYERRTRHFLKKAAQPGDGPDDALWTARAQVWAKQRAENTPLARRVRLANREVVRGDRGPAVAEIQRRVGTQADGIFGKITERTLKAWQESNGLEPTGRVDLATLEKHEEYTRRGVRWSPGDAWRSGRRLGPIPVVAINGRWVEVQTARAYREMRAAALLDGIVLQVVSGFRTNAQQQALRQRDEDGTGNPAARPGYSSHQDGRALDLNTNPAVLEWLEENASWYGFFRTVRSEPWHWVY